MSTKGTYEDATHEVDVEEPIEVGDLLDDPRTDVEALCLCALLWSPADTASDVSELLRSTDFERGVYGELFEVITAQVRNGAPHDLASIAATLTQSGRTGGHRGARLTRALSEATIAGAVPETVGHYAVAVLSATYHRGFHRAVQSMAAAAAEQLPQGLAVTWCWQVRGGDHQRTWRRRAGRGSAARRGRVYTTEAAVQRDADLT